MWQIRDGLFRPDMKTGQQYHPPVVLGFDAAGVVESIGSEVRRFKVGDAVMYSSDPYRPGSFQQYQVDERIVGHKPSKLSFEEAAALPLTSLTAWEALHEVSRTARARVRSPSLRGHSHDSVRCCTSVQVMAIGQQSTESGRSILITAGAGGVGSIASQLAKYRGKKLGLPPVEYCFNAFSDRLLPALVPVTKPVDGHICGQSRTQHRTQLTTVLSPLSALVVVLECASGITGEFSAQELTALQEMWTRRIQCNNELMFAKVSAPQRASACNQHVRDDDRREQPVNVQTTSRKTGGLREQRETKTGLDAVERNGVSCQWV